MDAQSWYLGYVVVYFAVMFSIGIYYFFKVKNANYQIGRASCRERV